MIVPDDAEERDGICWDRWVLRQTVSRWLHAAIHQKRDAKVALVALELLGAGK